MGERGRESERGREGGRGRQGEPQKSEIRGTNKEEEWSMGHHALISGAEVEVSGRVLNRIYRQFHS